MCALQPRRDGRARVAAGIEDMFPIMMFRGIQQGFDAGLREAPSTCVQRLFLTPDDVLGVGVSIEVFFQLCPGEGIQLLDPRDCGVFDSLASSMLVKRHVDLSAAQNHTFDGLWVVDRLAVLRVGDDPLEVRVPCEILDRGTG